MIGVGRNDGGGGGSSNGVLKKGPWTASEDAILVDYVRKHGEGNWNAVQKNTGLQRCGKSCRLRWANHLRPNLKKGAFSHDEERLIIEMHSKLGNKWARISAHLPGRTDNEVKNYWNTRVKRRLRQGLPLYPQDLQSSSSSSPPLLHHHPQPPPPQLPSFSYLKTPPNPSLFDPTSYSFPTSLFSLYPPPPPAQLITPPLQNRRPTPPIQDQFLCDDQSDSMNSFQLNHHHHPVGNFGFDNSITNDTDMIIEPVESFGNNNNIINNNPYYGSVFEMNSELPLNQIISSPNLSPAVEIADEGEVIRNNNNDNNLGMERSNSGLLDALLEEAREKVASGNLKKEKDDLMDSELQWQNNFSSSEMSYGVKKESEPEPEPDLEPEQDNLTAMNGDLSNILDLIPSLVRAPEWCSNENCETSIGQSSISSDDNIGGPEMAPSFPHVAAASSTEEDDWNPGSYTWNNLSRIY